MSLQKVFNALHTGKLSRILEKVLKTTCEEINFFREVVESSQVFPGSMRNLYRIIPGA